jgi:hypothetical protein
VPDDEPGADRFELVDEVVPFYGDDLVDVGDVDNVNDDARP